MYERMYHAGAAAGKTCGEYVRIHLNRIAGCNCDHRDSCGNAAARAECGKGKSAFHSMCQQYQAAVAGDEDV